MYLYANEFPILGKIALLLGICCKQQVRIQFVGWSNGHT